MKGFLCLLAAGLYLSLQCQVNAESHLSRVEIERIVIAAKANVDSAYEYSRKVSIERVRRNAVSPSDILRTLKQPVGMTRNAVRAADYMHYAVELIQKSLHRRRRRSINATDLITEETLGVIADLTGCSPRHRSPSCRASFYSPYRTASSTCNNQEHLRFGSSNTPFTRWLPAEYEDSTYKPRGWDNKTINNHYLPLVLEVSNRIMATGNDEVTSDPLYTFMVTIFAQWMDHDLTFTPHSPVIRSFNNGIDCDESCDRTEPCFPIKIPSNDRRFGKDAECMPFFRSAAGCGSGQTGHVFGSSTTRQQMNAITAFIDVGQVYGSDPSKAHFLRDLSSDDGLMRVNKMYNDSGREILPFSNTVSNICANRARMTNDENAEEVPCFQAGDERSNENIALTTLHTLFLREHNRLARALAKLNPHWDGERLYQEARKIMGAYLQVITFRDYLAHIVGPDFMAKQLSTYPGYDDSVDPSISNVFATAAYRFAHLMIPPVMPRLNEQFIEHPTYPSPMLHKAFFTPWRIIFEGGLDPILRGLVGSKAKLNMQDQMMPEELRDKLFKFTNTLALDLAALNIQRGRDHGISGYNKWRKFCGLSQPRNLIELAEVLNNTVLATKLMDLYGTPENIDVWLGGVAEPFVPGGRVGPLFACLIATQFEKIRKGDRLWWENDGVFTEAQRESLKNTSLARIICDNTGITEVPEKPFQYRPRGSGYTPCANIEAFDLDAWKDDGSNQKGSPGPRGRRGLSGPSGRPGPPGPPGTMFHSAFSMRLGNFRKAGGPLKFSEVIYNGQKSYDSKTGYFTCEYPGVYEFQFHATVYNREATLDLMRNGKRVLHSFTTRQSGYISASGSMIIRLEKWDKVYLVSDYGDSGLTADSSFSGHFLFTE
ncbi:hypothetical protein NQZ68_027756 [Dissostichus eleginoides]|nr:hypothetical protein NQZ68_027756 [Dissostichus eleginoides]